MAEDNKYGFMRDVQLDEDGNVMTWVVTRPPTPEHPHNQYGFYHDIELTDDGYLKITIIK